MVRQKGFEPPAYCLEGSCSILLSYWRKWMEQVTGIEPASPAWKAGALAIVLHLQEPSATCQLLHDSTEVFRCQAKVSVRNRKTCKFRRITRKTSCNSAQVMVSYHGMQRYRSGHNGADSKSCNPFIRTEYFSSGDVPKWLKGLHSKCSRRLKSAREFESLHLRQPAEIKCFSGFLFCFLR